LEGSDIAIGGGMYSASDRTQKSISTKTRASRVEQKYLRRTKCISSATKVSQAQQRTTPTVDDRFVFQLDFLILVVSLRNFIF